MHYRWLEPNRRLYAQHGPIELIIEVDAEPHECTQAFEQAVAFLDSVLSDLVAELPALRSPLNPLNPVRFESPVAKHMQLSVSSFSDQFITPMAAVAGSVADKTLQALTRNRSLRRAFVNNGGDIALHLTHPSNYTIGVCDDPVTGKQAGCVQLDALSQVRGLASSGWQGRSHSLGIADVVTVLANTAGTADAAATLIANHVDIPDSDKIQRTQASELSPDSDLAERLVTVGVLPLSSNEKHRALSRGQNYAQLLLNDDVIIGAFLCLQGEFRFVGATQLIPWRQTA